MTLKKDDPRHLFVYGTLMRASPSPYARLLRTRAQFVGEACAQGRLYHLGRFPGAVFGDDCGSKVHGELFKLRTAALLAILDAYEGCASQGSKADLFYRDVVEVQLTRGPKLTAWVYPFAGRVSGRPLVASGRFPL